MSRIAQEPVSMTPSFTAAETFSPSALRLRKLQRHRGQQGGRPSSTTSLTWRAQASPTRPEEPSLASVVRAAPVRSWAIAVCVCVNCMIYHGITVHHCTLVRVHTRARLAAAQAWEHKTNRTLSRGPSRAPKRLICTDKPHAICGPQFPRYLCLSSGAELTPPRVGKPGHA